MNYYLCAKDLTELKKKFIWLKEVDASALQNSLRALDAAYKNFVRGKKKQQKCVLGFPRFKSKHVHRKSFRSTASNIKVNEKNVYLPKLGNIRCKISRKIKGRIVAASILQVPSGKYFVILCCTDVAFEEMHKTGESIVFKNVSVDISPKYQKRLARYQRALSRKPKDSKRREKARIKAAKMHEKITNFRKDVLHKLSRHVIDEYDVITVSSEVRGELLEQLKYKAIWYGKTIVQI